MIRSVELYLNDIIEAIDLIEYSTKGITKQVFMEDKEKQDANIRRIEIIGEAVKGVSEKIRTKYPGVEWSKIAGSRDVLIHAYFGVNLNMVWKIIKERLPQLKKQIKEILKDVK